jgi:hypothetical protein
VTALKVFLAGEGATELGRERQLPHGRGRQHVSGVLEALVERVAPCSFTVVGREYWAKPVEYGVGIRTQPERTKVLGLALKAEEHGADVLVFARDRDRRSEREQAVEQGLRDAASKHQRSMAIVGGVAIESTEAWILALKGERDSESHRDPKSALRERYRISTVEEKVAAVRDTQCARIPDDAQSLCRWLDRARAAFNPNSQSD